MKSFFEEHKHLLFLLIAGIFLIYVPFLVRPSLLPSGHVPYIVEGMVEQGLDNKVITTGFGPAAFLFGLVAQVAPTGAEFLVFSLLTGLLTLWIGFVLLERLSFAKNTICITLLLLAASPPFMYTFSSLPHIALALPLMLLMVYCFTLEHKLAPYGAALCALILFLCGPMVITVTLLLLFATLYLRTRKAYLLVGLAGVIFTSFVYFLSPYFSHPFHVATGIPLDIRFILSTLVSDLGSTFGFGIFHVMLMAYGIILTWKKKHQFAPFYLILVFLFILSIFIHQHFALFSSFLAILFVGIGFITILKRVWYLPLVKDLATIIIICGLLFSTVSYANRVSTAPPEEVFLEGLQQLGTLEPGVVLSHYSHGPYISAVAQQPPFLDGMFSHGTNASSSLEVAETIFASQDIVKTLSSLSENKISYIFIDTRMRSGLVWKQPGRGLLFLLRNEEAFPLLYSNEDIHIYGVNYNIQIS